MVDAPPARPVTLPEPSTEALVLDELHTPPAAASVSANIEPAHIGPVLPVIVPAFGNGLTVSTAVAAAEPHAVVAV